MKISIITATFNSGKTIKRNIESVLSQSFKDFEHIIVDNESSDDTIKIAEKLYADSGQSDKLKIICEKDNGIADAFNKGIKSSSGEIIAILNSDDSYYDDEIFQLVLNSFKSPEIFFTHGDIYFIDPVYGTNIRRPLIAKMMKGVLYNHPTMFEKRALYDKIGFFNTDYKYSMDFEFYCRIAKNFDPEKISVYIKDKPIVTMHSGGASWNYELGSVEEIKKAMIEHNLWNSGGKSFYRQRKFSTITKKYLSKLGLFGIVKLWRRLKWGN